MSASIGDRISAARKASGETQEQLAAAIDTQWQQVSRWERSASTPRSKTLQAIAEHLNLRLDWLRTGKGPVYLDGAGGPEIVMVDDSPLVTELVIRPCQPGTVSIGLADHVAQFVIRYQELVGELPPAAQAALTVLLYQELERRGLNDPKAIEQSELLNLIARAFG